MNDRIHALHFVDLLRNFAGLDCAAEVADDHAGRTRRKICDCPGTLSRPRVQNHLMALLHERLRRRAAEPFGAAGDENTSQETFHYDATASEITSRGRVSRMPRLFFRDA
jgi:hypothetical protein